MEIKEAYCSFEIAKLLKEKGFNEPIRCWYDNFEVFHEEGVKMSNTDCLPPTIMCPTHQMAMAWLREIHKIHIEVWATYDTDTEEHTGWGITVSDLSDFGGLYFGDASGYKTYEETVEAALKYVLENLI